VSRIFISYRREDTAGYAGRICASLKHRFGEDEVFMDVEGIEPGEDFVAVVDERIKSAELVLALIGKQWSTSADPEGNLRLWQPDDLLRLEIAAAIERRIRIVPVLLSGSTMPGARDVPDLLVPVTRLNAFEVRDQFFEDSMTRLAEYVQRWGIGPATVAHPKQTSASVNPDHQGFINKKICLMGAAGVGKTSLVRRFVQSIFSDSYLTTIGVRIDKKEVVLGPTRVKLIIWDLAGEEEGVATKLGYITGSNGLILVADGCRSSSLDVALDLRQRAVEIVGPVPTALAVNKVDLHDEWQVQMDDLEDQGRIGAATFTTSAKTGKAVEALFKHLARKLVT
jgi:small GTP-binding protein